jgi:hypothetical protein
MRSLVGKSSSIPTHCRCVSLKALCVFLNQSRYGGKERLAIAEAKGSYQSAAPSQGARPGPIKTADKQISSVRIQRRIRRAGDMKWVDRSFKGWAVMSRWGIEDPPREPYLFVFDPETLGEPLREDEISGLVQEVAREHVRQTLEGLGYGDLIPDPNKVGPIHPPTM